MTKKTIRYTPEFKRQMVELVRGGRTPASLAKEFGPTPWSIGLWVKQAARDAGKGDGGLTTAERAELAQLRRENRKLKTRLGHAKLRQEACVEDVDYGLHRGLSKSVMMDLATSRWISERTPKPFSGGLLSS